jgi:16S rRNA (uracil1498-N3)-methyltransferase
MADRDATLQRLFVEADLAPGLAIACAPPQAHYLRNVLRMAEGDAVLVFDGANGEWRAAVRHDGKRGVVLDVSERVRAQTEGPDVEFLFAPLKRTRLDYVVQKATELGVARIRPVTTARTVAERLNLDRLDANIIEAAEQCGILRVPALDEVATLTTVLDTWTASRTLIFCDEAAPIRDPIEALDDVPDGPIAVLIGPEGGFTDEERRRLRSLPFVKTVSLGPRIMRADTAAVAILALVNAVLGDWAE